MQLRPYQSEAIAAVYEHLRTRDDNPCVVIPTGGGKTPVIATICRDAVGRWGGRVVLLAHVKELLEQAADKLRAIAPDVPMGIYSAGLKRKDLGYAVTVAGIQSIWKKACDLGLVDLIIVDEAHMVPAEDDGMYRQFIADAKVVNPSVRVVGLTATPYRLKSGPICVPAPHNILNHVCYEVGVRELIVQGFLSPLRTKAGLQRISTDDLHVRAGEFVASEVEDLMDKEGLPVVTGKRAVRHVLFDTNFWKSFVHARLSVPMGDPGGLSLFGQRPEHHRLLAEHLTSEYRVRTEGRGRTVDEWKLRVDGLDNHWLDGMVGCAVAASMQGAVLFGTDQKVAARPRLKLSALKERPR